jgi:hypothetical protein
MTVNPVVFVDHFGGGQHNLLCRISQVRERTASCFIG